MGRRGSHAARAGAARVAQHHIAAIEASRLALLFQQHCTGICSAGYAAGAVRVAERHNAAVEAGKLADLFCADLADCQRPLTVSAVETEAKTC